MPTTRTTRSLKNAAKPEVLPKRIETTRADLQRSFGALQRLAQRALPIKHAYHLKRLLSMLEPHLKTREVRRAKLAGDLGIHDGTRPTPEVSATYASQVEALDAEAVTIHWQPFPLALLGETTMAAGDLLDLGPLVWGEPAGGGL